MHNKILIIDNKTVVTGSYNFSENAEANDENMLVIESPQVATAYTNYFDALFRRRGPNADGDWDETHQDTDVTLVYGAHGEKHNDAIVLREVLLK